MKLVGVLVCAATVLCASASPLEDLGANSRAAGCTFNPECDTTGEEKIPIPCEGFCDKYFFCQNGKPTMEHCHRTLLGFKQYFNNYNRKCETSFKDCDWWKTPDPDQSTTPNPGGSTPSVTPDPSNPTGGTPSQSTSVTGSTAASTTEGPCQVNADCDATGTEKKPIPCAGFCNKYYLCVEGVPSVETCATFNNFDYITRQCSTSFKDCNWYKALETTSTPTAGSTAATAPGSSAATTPKPPPNTTKKPNTASSLVYSTTALLMAILMPLLARYL